ASSQMWFVRGVVRADELELLARLVAAEAEGEPYAGQVAVAAVVLNRVDSPQFPNSISGVAYQPLAFESVSNGLIWRRQPSAQAYNAARDALNGWDPSYGSLFFWNPSKPVSPWIWSRNIVGRSGGHVLGRGRSRPGAGGPPGEKGRGDQERRVREAHQWTGTERRRRAVADLLSVLLRAALVWGARERTERGRAERMYMAQFQR